jgi:hypothetical protein
VGGRQLGGRAGRGDARLEVVNADVPVIEDFAQAILEYLYRAPAKLDALRASIKVRRDAANVGGK